MYTVGKNFLNKYFYIDNSSPQKELRIKISPKEIKIMDLRIGPI